MTFIALDDEPIALAVIARHAKDIPDLQLLATFTDAAAAAEYLRQNPVDLLLTDINMPDINGLDFVRSLPDERPMVMFVTAYKEHAHEGFDLEVVDYLVKPVAPERFRRAMEKASELLDLRRRAETDTAVVPPPEDHFYVFSEYVQVKITIADITYIESMGDYVKIHLASQSRPVISLERIKNLASRLEARGFWRIHRSYVVHAARIEAKKKGAVLVAGVWLPVGETYQPNINGD